MITYILDLILLIVGIIIKSNYVIFLGILFIIFDFTSKFLRKKKNNDDRND